MGSFWVGADLAFVGVRSLQRGARDTRLTRATLFALSMKFEGRRAQCLRNILIGREFRKIRRR
jgi:hypothetical protein